MALTIYYDGDCPFCTRYVQLLRLREAAADPDLINLRHAPEARKRLENEGFDLDQGMVVDLDGRRYGGGAAMNILALLSTPSGIINRLNVWIFARPWLALMLYPLLRAGRNATLFFLGRRRLNQSEPSSGPNDAVFRVFSQVFGLFAFLHFLLNVFRYGVDPFLSTYIVGVLGAWLFLRPASSRLFALLIIAMVIDAWLIAPVFSNHTILKNFLLLGVLVVGGWHWLAGNSWHRFFGDLVPIGRALLLVMYFFGVFHKINTDFLDPASSCAVELWRLMPAPLNWIDGLPFQYLAIYGTLVIESLLIVMLLLPRWRHAGIVLGVGFHGLLGLSGYAMYPTFSTLSIALHCLFLSNATASQIEQSQPWQGVQHRLRSPLGLLVSTLFLGMLGLNAWLQNLQGVALTWSLLIIPLWFALIVYGRPEMREGIGRSERVGLLPSRKWMQIVGVAFFINCALPYMGLKTAQTMNMFANLTLEGGQNNHLVLPGAPYGFGFLDDVVEMEAAAGNGYLVWSAQNGLSLTWYDLLDKLDRHPEARATFIRDGIRFESVSRDDLADAIDATLHPRWFRKWFHFTPVNLTRPKPCGPIS